VSSPASPGAPDELSAEEVFGAIKEIAQTQLGWTGMLTPEMRLIEDLQLDSIRLLTLTVEVENRFRVRLDEHDDAGLETVGDLVALVKAKHG
jgi:acyl carrier protein